MPMGLCFPGTGSSGDLPPRPICAETWRQPVLDQLGQLQLTVVIGRYAIDWHMPAHRKSPITKVAQAWADHWPGTIALPHPSPRNNIWLRRNPWFAAEVLPRLRDRVRDVLASGARGLGKGQVP
jgi:uracil-DNA glycosylase